MITVTTNVIRIEDGYKTTSKKLMRTILNNVHLDHPECLVFNRKMGSLVREWTAHNRLYKLGLYKSHTKDVDLEYPIKWYYELAWFILGCLGS